MLHHLINEKSSIKLEMKVDGTILMRKKEIKNEMLCLWTFVTEASYMLYYYASCINTIEIKLNE